MHAVKYWILEPHGGWHVVLALCSALHRCAAACIAAGGASDVRMRACGVCRAHRMLACGCVASMATRNDHASSPHLPPTSGQALCSTAAGVCKFIMRRESETESESADFFTNPSETVRLPDFENRNNTNLNTTLSHLLATKFTYPSKT